MAGVGNTHTHIYIYIYIYIYIFLIYTHGGLPKRNHQKSVRKIKNKTAHTCYAETKCYGFLKFVMDL